LTLVSERIELAGHPQVGIGEEKSYVCRREIYFFEGEGILGQSCVGNLDGGWTLWK